MGPGTSPRTMLRGGPVQVPNEHCFMWHPKMVALAAGSQGYQSGPNPFYYGDYYSRGREFLPHCTQMKAESEAFEGPSSGSLSPGQGGMANSPWQGGSPRPSSSYPTSQGFPSCSPCICPQHPI